MNDTRSGKKELYQQIQVFVRIRWVNFIFISRNELLKVKKKNKKMLF